MDSPGDHSRLAAIHFVHLPRTRNPYKLMMQECPVTTYLTIRVLRTRVHFVLQVWILVLCGCSLGRRCRTTRSILPRRINICMRIAREVLCYDRVFLVILDANLFTKQQPTHQSSTSSLSRSESSSFLSRSAFHLAAISKILKLAAAPPSSSASGN